MSTSAEMVLREIVRNPGRYKQEHLAEKVGIHRNTCRRAIRELERKQLITASKLRQRGIDGVYTLHPTESGIRITTMYWKFEENFSDES